MAKINKKENIEAAIDPSISKRKLKLDDVNEFAENIINTVREPLLVLDKDLRVIKATRSFYDFFKVNHDETIGTLIYDLGNHQWNIPKLRELLETILPEKTTFDNYEVEHAFSTIGKRVMLLNARQIKRAVGKDKIILLAFEDITERKLTEESIIENHRITNEYLDILFNHANVPIIIWDASWVIKRINDAFEKLSGYHWTELIDKKIDILFQKDKIGSALESIKNTLSNEKFEVIEIDILTKVSDIRTVLWNSANIYDKEGKNIVATIAQDITKRKRTEEALAVLETRYRRLFESAKDGVLILDAETGKIIDVNPFLMELLDYSKEEFVEKAIWEIGFFRDIAANEDKFFELQQREYVRYENLPLETADGRKINVEFVSNVYLVNHHKVIQCNIRDITERKRTEYKLQKSEERYRSIFENVQDVYYEASIDGTILEISPSIEILSKKEYNREDLIGKSAYDLYSNAGERQALLAILHERGSVTDYEIILKNRDGSQVPCSISAKLQFNAQNKPLKIIGSMHDITERKWAEETMRESEAKYRALVTQSPDGIFIVGLSGTFLSVNKAMCDKLKYTEEEFLTMKIWDIVPQRYLSLHKKRLAAIIKNESKNEAAEYEVTGKDGTVHRIEVLSAPYYKNKDIIGFQGIARDITGRKRAEEEIIMLAHSLKSINECVSITDMEDKILFVNESFTKTYGYDENELVGKQMTIVRSPNNSPELVNEILPATLRGGWQGELWNNRKDGSEFPVYLSTTIINDKDSKPLGLIGVATDITERKQILEELITAKEKAEQADKLKTEFLAQISHEIRTPLSSIIGNVDYINDLFNKRLDPDVNYCFDSIDISSKRIIRTVDLILNTAEFRTIGYKPRFMKFDLNKEILNVLYREFQHSAKQKGLQIKYNCNAEETKVIADVYSITQIFANLIDNAIKYTKEGKVEIILAKNITGNIIVEVKDTGIGISKEFLPKIFEPFSQEEQGYTRSYDGNGLGLSLVKNYCELNNATIDVESEKNVGSSFKITFDKQVNS
ncbi:MAG: PAS domain S-box protein [bacterium]